MAKTNLTAERLRELLDYDPVNGTFTWRVNRNGVRIGDRAGSLVDSRGYLRVGIDGREYSAHRLAWLYVHGEWPTQVIDHCNGDPSDNRIENLRDVSQQVNVQNQHRARSTNKCGLLGVRRQGKRWYARIMTNGRERHIGTFDTPEEAHAAYLAVKAVLHVSGRSSRG